MPSCGISTADHLTEKGVPRARGGHRTGFKVASTCSVHEPNLLLLCPEVTHVAALFEAGPEGGKRGGGWRGAGRARGRDTRKDGSRQTRLSRPRRPWSNHAIDDGTLDELRNDSLSVRRVEDQVVKKRAQPLEAHADLLGAQQLGLVQMPEQVGH